MKRRDEDADRMARLRRATPEYGIGRVPADVDPTEELLAAIEAEEIMAAQQPPARTEVRHTSRCSYRGCRRPGYMMASLGPACDEHYDELSDV